MAKHEQLKKDGYIRLKGVVFFSRGPVGRYDASCISDFTLYKCINRYMTGRLAHLHTESPAAFNELGNVPLTLAVAPRFLEKL